jgi:hypothetical protein
MRRVPCHHRKLIHLGHERNAIPPSPSVSELVFYRCVICSDDSRTTLTICPWCSRWAPCPLWPLLATQPPARSCPHICRSASGARARRCDIRRQCRGGLRWEQTPDDGHYYLQGFPLYFNFFNQFLINEPDQFYFSHLTLLSVSLVDTAYEGVTSCDTTQEADAWSDGDAASCRCQSRPLLWRD